MHGKNSFAAVSKNLARYRSENKFYWTIKINRTLKVIARMSKFFAALPIMFEFLPNYFDGSTKLFSDLYLAKFLDTAAKSFFPCDNIRFKRISFTQDHKRSIPVGRIPANFA